MNKRKINFIGLLTIGLLCLAGSTKVIIEHANIDLSDADSVTGIINFAQLTKMENYTFRYSSYKRVYHFRLHNSNQNFAIHRSDGGYHEFQLQLKPGDTVKVFYQPTSRDFNTNVLQVEKNGTAIAAYSDYHKELSSKTGIILFLGVIITTGAIIWYRRINLLRFMKELAEGRQAAKDK